MALLAPALGITDPNVFVTQLSRWARNRRITKTRRGACTLLPGAPKPLLGSKLMASPSGTDTFAGVPTGMLSDAARETSPLGGLRLNLCTSHVPPRSPDYARPVMNRWRGHATRHPLWGAVELTLAWHVVLVLFAKVILPPLAPSWFPGLGATVVNAVCSAGAWLVLWRWGWLRTSGVATLGRVRRWWLAVPMLLVACSYALAGLDGSTTVLVSSLVSLLWVGINEEVSSRGLVQQVLAPLGAMRAAIGVGVLFGVGHVQNYLFFDAPLDDTLWQMLSAGLFGFACAGLRFAIGSVWPMVVVHGLDDFFQIHSPGAAPDWWQVCVYVFHAAFGVWLLRRYGSGAAAELHSVVRDDRDGRSDQAGALD
ncbi:CPBP family intramembrane glutamic endopeptidase [Streptomyces sp. NPDC002763]|uniref:CPBP family intramembrane glutamic endopeptidase n=1 Tax=Streptomyces sp. NPDC002763 TaxID=3154427 RepID=UPI0033337184